MLIEVTPRQLQLLADVTFDRCDTLMHKLEDGVDSRNEYRDLEERYEESKELFEKLSGQRKHYVVEYVKTREYGGPEEGGWYYDAWTMVRIAAECEDESTAVDIREALDALTDDEQPYTNYHSTGVTRYIVDDVPGEMQRPAPIWE